MKVTLSYYSLFYDLFKPRVRQLLFQDKGGKEKKKMQVSLEGFWFLLHFVIEHCVVPNHMRNVDGVKFLWLVWESTKRTQKRIRFGFLDFTFYHYGKC